MHNPWVQFILLLAPVLLVPLVLYDLRSIWHYRLKKKLGILAVASLLTAHVMPPGPTGGILAVPWLIFSIYLFWLIRKAWQIQGRIINSGWILRLGAFAYLCVGALWAVADRFSWQPLGFDPMIVLLTAVHFHYAGFALLWIGAKALPYCRSNGEKYLLSSVILGVPLTAIGITASQLNWSPVIEMSAVMAMAAGGITVGLVHLRTALNEKGPLLVRALWLLAGLSLPIGMGLAVLYGMRYLWPLPWLSIPWMYAVHGALNSLGFALPAILGWHFHRADQSTRLP